MRTSPASSSPFRRNRRSHWTQPLFRRHRADSRNRNIELGSRALWGTACTAKGLFRRWAHPETGALFFFSREWLWHELSPARFLPTGGGHSG